MDFRERLWRFMSGRYGVDETFFAITAVSVILAIINSFVRSLALQAVVYVLMILAVLRVFSKNTAARSRENRAFKSLSEKISAKRAERNRRKADFRHVYKKCPHCGAVLRLPRRKGKHKTVCPRCSKEFTVFVFKE